MKSIFKALLPAFLSSIAAVASPFAANAQEGVFNPPQPQGPLSLQIPEEYKHLLLEDAKVEFILLLDEKGSIQELLPTFATHFDLIANAQKLLERTEFTPAAQDGKPRSIRMEILVTFKDINQEIWRATGQLPMGSNTMEGAGRKIVKGSLLDHLYKESNIDQLDSPPQLISGGIVVVKSADGVAANGSVKVEYFIDSEGNAILPTLLKSDGDLVSLSAIRTIENLKFQPIRSNNKPTYTRVRQTFNFKDSE